jgi:S-adenosylmethionine decarboxylase
MFGPHLILDGRDANRNRLESVPFVHDLLAAFPEKIEMTKIMPPYVFRQEEGLSGIVLIAESHISIHTYPKKGRFNLDILSCKEFDVDRALEFALSELEPKRFQQVLLSRGREFPRSLGRAAAILKGERERI